MSHQQQQLDFDAADQAAIESTRPKTRRELFEAFHADNPQVYEWVKEYTQNKVDAGFKRWGFEAIWNDIRWNQQCQTSGKPFKLNNNYKAFYVRKLINEFPHLEGFFEQRCLTKNA